MRGEVLLLDGVPRGLFRVETESRWALASALYGQVDGPCWIVYPNYVRDLDVLNAFSDGPSLK
jgi:hypothetical protein